MLDPVRDAGYQAGHHDECLPGTRESVLQEAVRWVENPQDRHVFWLKGLAGTGTSTIAQTFSKAVVDAGSFHASFFCSRSHPDRKDLKRIIPTIAHQLACRSTTLRNRVIGAIKPDPSVAGNSLVSQFKNLVMDPLSSTDVRCVIVVDALDQCVDDQPTSPILSVLGHYVKDPPSVKFFITGRPEPRIRRGFRLPPLEPFTQLHQVESSLVNNDIRLYLQKKIAAVAKGRNNFHVPDLWPSDQDLTTPTERSSKLFIFASTLVKFISSEYHGPNKRLQLIISSEGSTSYGGEAGINALYNQVLEEVFQDASDAAVFENLRVTLGAVIMAFNPLSREDVAKPLGADVAVSLRHLHSVLLVPTKDPEKTHPFHESFPDFLQDPKRCSNPKFFIDPLTHHGDIALGCLGLLKKLKPNPCDLPDFATNQDVPQFEKLLGGKVESVTSYACGYWAMHVRSSPTTGDYPPRLITSATEFFRANGIQWIEVMSLENRLENVIRSIHNLFDWFYTVRTRHSM